MSNQVELELVVIEKGLKTSISTVERLERQIRKAQKALDQNTISQDRYNKILLSAKREYQALGVSSQKATAQVRAFAAANKVAQTATNAQTVSLNSATVATNKLNVAQSRTKNKMNGTNMAIQQAGYQFGDFAVQVQGGTSAFVAFSQQGAQLAGILPSIAEPLGMSLKMAVGLSAAFSVLIPVGSALGRMFFEMRDSSKQAAEKLKTFEQNLKSAKEEIISMTEAHRLLKSGFETEQELALNDALIEATANYRLLLIAKQNVANQPFESEANKLASLTIAQAKLDSAKEQLDLARDNFKAHRDAAAALERENRNQERNASVINQLHQVRQDQQREAREEQTRINALEQEVAEYAKNHNWEKTQLQKTTQQLLTDAIEIHKQEKAIREELGDAAVEALKLAGVDIASGVSAAAKAAASLAADLGISLAAALTMQSMLSAEDLAMSQPVVTGSVTDRYNVEDLMSMGYTKEYLTLVGKIKEETRSAGAATKDFVSEALELNEANDPLLKFNNGLADLDKLMATGKLTQRAYNAELGKLQDGLIDSVPLVAELSSAFADFVGRGFKDFKGFVSDVLKAFKNMLLNMMAMAAKNRIMVSLGIGGNPVSQAGGGIMSSMLGTMGTGASMAAGSGATGFMGTLAGGTGAMGAVGNFAAGGYSAMTGTALASGAVGTTAAAIGAIAAPLLAIAAVFSFFKKKVKVLDTGLKLMVDGFTVAAESFEKIRTTRFFGLSKKDTTTTKALSDEETSPLQDAVNDIQNAVVDAANALDLGSAAWDSFSYEFKLSLKGLDDAAKDAAIVAELTKMGDAFASLTGHFETMEELLATAAQRQVLNIRLLELQGNTEKVLTLNREAELNATHDLNKPMLLHIHALQDQATAYANLSNAMTNLGGAMAYALSEAKSGLDTAAATLSSAISSEVKGINSSFDKILDNLNEGLDVAVSKAQASQDIFDLLKTSLSDRTSVAQGSYGASRTSALSYVSSGGTDIDRLSSALGVLNAPSEQLFSTFEDYARDFAKTSNVIKKSKEAAERTLTADEKAVLRLEDQIELTKELRDTQISALESLLTTEENIISVAQAIQEMAEAQVTYDEANALNDKLLEEYPELNRSILSVVDAVRAVEAAQGAYAASITSAITAAAASAAASASATASVSERAIKEEKEITIVNSFKGGIFGKSGITLSNGQTFKTHKGFGDGKEIKNATQMARDALIAQGITPAFASGGMHSGGLRMVGENGPELEVTGPSRIYSNTQTKSMLSETGDDRLRLEVSSLRVDMKALMMQISKNTGKSARQLDRWDQDGLPQERVV